MNGTSNRDEAFLNRKVMEALYEQKCMYLLGKYLITRNLMEQESSPEMIRQRKNNDDYDEWLFHHVDKCLNQCSDETQLIIRKEFLEESPEKWYEPYYSFRSYRYRKQKAIKQFIDCTGF